MKNRLWIVGLVVFVGGASIYAGWKLEGHAYASSLLQGAGVTVLLVLPLLWLERVFEARVERSERAAEQSVRTVQQDVESVASQVADTRSELGRLQEGLADRLSAADDADQALVEAAESEVSFARSKAFLNARRS